MKVPVPPLLEEALGFPGAILFRNDCEAFRNPSSLGYEIGIQTERAHKRFANIFHYSGETTLYIKHDSVTIAQLYERNPGTVLPSEIAGRYWSNTLLVGRPDQIPICLGPERYLEWPEAMSFAVTLARC